MSNARGPIAARASGSACGATVRSLHAQLGDGIRREPRVSKQSDNFTESLGTRKFLLCRSN